MILDGIRDRCRGTNRNSSQGESAQAHMGNDRGQVSDSSLETEVLNVSVGASHPAMVVADHSRSETDQSVRHFPRVRRSSAVGTRVTEDI